MDGAPVMVLDPGKEGAARYLDLARRYIAMGMPCGFLEGGECGIYEDQAAGVPGVFGVVRGGVL